jgi:hypothetical protein
MAGTNLLKRVLRNYFQFMQTTRGSLYIGVAWISAMLLGSAIASEPAPAPAPDTSTVPQPATAQCKEAVVSPVSGFAECVDPRGAPVAPPPKRPDAPPAATDR